VCIQFMARVQAVCAHHPPERSLTDAQMIRKRRIESGLFLLLVCSCMHTLQSGAFLVAKEKKSRLSGFFLGLNILVVFIIILLAPSLFQAVI